MFKLLRRSTELKDQIKYNATYHDSLTPISMDSLVGTMTANKKLHKRVKTRLDLLKEDKDEDEDPNVANITKKNQKVRKKSLFIKRAAELLHGARPPQANDRLAEDKMYLSILSGRLERRTDIPIDKVHKSVKKTAAETFEFLKRREAFWEQLELRKESSETKHIESYRWLM
jgi:hypothetical protein